MGLPRLFPVSNSFFACASGNGWVFRANAQKIGAWDSDTGPSQINYLEEANMKGKKMISLALALALALGMSGCGGGGSSSGSGGS